MIDTQIYRNISKETGCEVTINALCDEIDRLRAGKPKPQGKTDEMELKIANMRGDRWASLAGEYVKERDAANQKLLIIATGLDDLRIKYLLQGNVHFNGKAFSSELDDLLKRTADLPIPEETTVEGKVENA